MREIDIYTDLDLSFSPHPITGDVSIKKNTAAIQRALKHIFSLRQFDVPFDAYAKSDVESYLFEHTGHVTRAAIQSSVEYAIKKFEPRAKLNSVTVTETSDGLGFDITINYSIKSLAVTEETRFTFRRTR